MGLERLGGHASMREICKQQNKEENKVCSKNKKYPNFARIQLWYTEDHQEFESTMNFKTSLNLIWY